MTVRRNIIDLAVMNQISRTNCDSNFNFPSSTAPSISVEKLKPDNTMKAKLASSFRENIQGVGVVI